MTFVRVTLAMGLLTVLAALYGCGGGSGGSTPSGNMAGTDNGMPGFGVPGFIDPRIEADDWRHQFAADARANTGGQVPTLSSSGHDAKLRQIIADSDVTMQLGWYNPGNGWQQLDPNCSGTTCDYNNPEIAPLTKENAFPAQEFLTILPMMNRRGAEISYGVATGEGNLGPWGSDYFESYGGSLDHAFFGTAFHRWWESGEWSTSRHVWGAATGSNPTMGSASWSGVMIGVADAPDLGATHYVQGDTDATVHFGVSTTLDVAFSNVTGVENGTRHTIDPWVAIPVTNGSFQSGRAFGIDGHRYLEGQFFGPDAEEIAGVFYDWLNSDPNFYIGGAFGATRDAQ